MDPHLFDSLQYMKTRSWTRLGKMPDRNPYWKPARIRNCAFYCSIHLYLDPLAVGSYRLDRLVQLVGGGAGLIVERVSRVVFRGRDGGDGVSLHGLEGVLDMVAEAGELLEVAPVVVLAVDVLRLILQLGFSLLYFAKYLNNVKGKVFFEILYVSQKENVRNLFCI